MNNQIDYLINNNVDYLETAKVHIARIDGYQTYDFIKAFSLAAIANALIAIAERMANK